MTRNRLATLASLAALATLTLTMGCGGGGGTPEQTSGTNLGDIKIGLLEPLTGPSASQGQDVLHGVELARDVLNGKYPEVGIPKLTVGKVSLVSSDTQSNPQIAASEVDRLVRTEKVAAIVGTYQSATTLTASERAERLGVPTICGSSSSTALTERGFKWFFRVGPSDKTFAETYFEWLKSIQAQHPVKKAVILHTNDQFGNDGAKIISEIAAKNSTTITDDISFQGNSTDMTSQVQKIRSANPDAVFTLAFTNDAILFVKTADQLGYTPPAILAFGAGWIDPTFIKVLGNKANYSITRASWAAQYGDKNPAAKAAASLFEKNYGQPMTENSAREFTAMITAGEAIQQAGSTDPEKIRTALRNYKQTKTIMPWKGIKFDSGGQNEEASGVIEQMINGRYELLWPADAATAKLVWPAPPLSGR